MKEKNTVYVIRGNKWVVKTVPSTKQTEEITTNISIECKICSRMVDKFVRIVRINGSSAYLNGICCDRCIFTHRFKTEYVLIDKDNNSLTPETITIGQVIPTNDRGWLDDSTKGEQFIKDRERYRNSVRNMIEINKSLGIHMPTFKQEIDRKIRTMDYIPIEVRREIYKRIKSGEIKI